MVEEVLCGQRILEVSLGRANRSVIGCRFLDDLCLNSYPDDI